MRVEIKPSEIESLAPMPVSVVQLASIATNEKATMEEMARIIEFDEALTANLLRLANSVWGRSVMPILTVKDAVVRLGTAQILKFCVGRQIAAPMTKAIPGYELGEHDLGRHSVASALAAEHLNSFLHKPVPRLAFTAALMHDIGKLLLGRHLGLDALGEIRRMVMEENIQFKAAEHRQLGTNHAEVGGTIARHWKFPQQLVDAIELHHDPDKEPNALVDVVHLANILAKRMGLGLGSTPKNMEVSDEVIGRLKISPPDLEAVCEKVMVELDEAEKVYMVTASVA